MSDIPLTPCLERLRTLASARKEGLDAETVHDLRVATGRLRVWLALSGMRVLQDDLSWLRRSAEPLRSLDVVIERLGSRTWARALGERRDLLLDEFVPTLSGSRVQGLVAALEVLPPLPAKSARKRTADLKEDVQRMGARARRNGGDLEPIHRLRRWVRKLRYAEEWQGVECSRLEGLQEVLGEVGDLATAHKYLVEIGANGGVDSGAEGDRVDVENELAMQRGRAVSAWKRARRDVEAL